MKRLLFLLFSSTLLHAVDVALPALESEPHLAPPNFSASEKLTHGYTFRPLPNSGSFQYLAIGAATHPISPNPLQSTLPSLSFGKRYLKNSFGWDSSIGIRFSEYSKQLYLHSSCLLYPLQPNKFYFGIGLEAGIQYTSNQYQLHYDLPLTLGYQFASSDRRSFLQLQAYPKASAADDDLTFAAAYGFGF